ncbi:putative late blight resistance protein homolog R1A-3 [Salvia splendens]|uniref:putative late blight resistance protein homolog R1A-3 n=1 Tax=Salvia splendens TaxID=180675 RepID=UPI001C26BE9B|nr:putative late blight resistance protein homolog R1A-3 [Salvia splendens]
MRSSASPAPPSCLATSGKIDAVGLEHDVEEYSFSDILANLLVSMKIFVREDISRLSKEEIPLKVHQTLTNRRYFIVIDVMWSTNAWDEIKPYFSNNNHTSRIILTTRLEDVAGYIVRLEKFHQMQYLKDDQSLSLLKKELCKGECRLPMVETMEDIATRITRSCGGLPLAIVVTAGLLSDKGGVWKVYTCGSRRVVYPTESEDIEEEVQQTESEEMGE